MEQKKTVLIVEDEKNIVDIIRFNLQRTGYNTLEAYDGEAGLAMAREKKPDLILLDGGEEHLRVALDVMRKTGVSIPAVGMVKDDHHKTRALITPEGEVSIAHERGIYGFIYRIQEEVHRFTVSKMTGAKRKTYRTSTLEKINGIGPVKAKLLLSALGGLNAVKNADLETLSAVNGISHAEAYAVFEYFHPEAQTEDNEQKGR